MYLSKIQQSCCYTESCNSRKPFVFEFIGKINRNQSEKIAEAAYALHPN